MFRVDDLVYIGFEKNRRFVNYDKGEKTVVFEEEKKKNMKLR